MSTADELELKTRLAFIEMTDERRAHLRAAKPHIEAAMPAALDVFYNHLRQWPQMRAMFGDNPEQSMDSARRAQFDHWRNIAAAKFDEDYARQVQKVGDVHKNIGLEPRWYLGGYAVLVGNIVRSLIDAHFKSPFIPSRKREALKDQVDAFLRAALLDMDLSISTYDTAKNDSFARHLEQITDSFDGRVRRFMEDLNTALSGLGESSENLSGLAQTELTKVDQLGDAAKQATDSVDTVASAAGQLSNSIDEISGQLEKSNTISRQAVDKAGEASSSVTELQQSAENINSVVNLINDIAERTNLLALNATIEAARAGEAGKGFAVVADEVKNLAKQTSNATRDIGEQVEGIKQSVNKTVDVIGEVSSIVQELHEIAGSISSAMEEQSSATQDIAGNAQQAAQSSRDVTTTTEDVRETGQRTEEEARRVKAATDEMRQRAETLRGEVETFLSNIKTQ